MGGLHTKGPCPHSPPPQLVSYGATPSRTWPSHDTPTRKSNHGEQSSGAALAAPGLARGRRRSAALPSSEGPGSTCHVQARPRCPWDAGFAGGARMETSRCCRPARVAASLSAIGCAARPQPFCCRLTQRVPLPCSLQAHISMGDIDLLHPPKELEQQRHKLKRLVQTPNSFFMDVKCPGCFNMCAYTPTRRHTCPMSCGSAHAATTHAAAQRRAVPWPPLPVC